MYRLCFQKWLRYIFLLVCPLSLWKNLCCSIYMLMGEMINDSFPLGSCWKHFMNTGRNIVHQLTPEKNNPMSLFYKYFHGHCSDELKELTPSLKTFSKTTRLSSAAHPLTIQIPNFHKSCYSSSFFPCTARLWNTLPSNCFPSDYDLPSFNSNVNQYLSQSL